MRDPASLVADVAAAHVDELPDLDERIVERLRGSVPEFFIDPDVALDMSTAISANVRRVHRLLSSGGERALPTALPADAEDLLQSTIQHGIPLISLLEAYRAAQSLAVDWWQRRLERVAPPGALAAATSVLLRTLDAYVDLAAAQIREHYETERRVHEGSAEGRRAHIVRRLLAEEPMDVGAASRTLGHPLDGRHVALTLMRFGDAELDREVTRLAEVVGDVRVLTLSARHRTYAWLSTRAPLDLAPLRDVEVTPGLAVAASTVHTGVVGFVRAHRDAVRTARLLRLATGRSGRVAFFEQFELATLLARDPEDLERFLERVLGDLVADTSSAGRARETLRAYLAEGSSPSRTARRLGVHRNTVTYRISQLREVIGDGDPARRLELQLALHLVEQLGPGRSARR